MGVVNMDIDRNRSFILDRVKSRTTSIEEFNFDQLAAPPLKALLSPTDIGDLQYIATSVKLSAKPEQKYKYIDEIMKRRGFVKFGAGTNRTVYRFLEDQSFLAKIAYDSVGMGDNPAEFHNQQFLKPFVPKTFEIDPSGVIALAERVNPITSREEFYSVADDVFTLIDEFLVGEYVLADIGSNFFMNYGIRKNFGVVLLDYTYCYPLDGNKLYCNKPDPAQPSGKCEGEIDYDAGFNHLYCKRCGAMYKAKELAAKVTKQEIVRKRQGDIKMKIRVKGGSKNLNMEKDTFTGVANTPARPIVKTNTNTAKAPEPVIKRAVNGIEPVEDDKIAEVEMKVADTSSCPSARQYSLNGNKSDTVYIDENVDLSESENDAEPVERAVAKNINDEIREVVMKVAVSDPVSDDGESVEDFVSTPEAGENDVVWGVASTTGLTVDNSVSVTEPVAESPKKVTSPISFDESLMNDAAKAELTDTDRILMLIDNIKNLVDNVTDEGDRERIAGKLDDLITKKDLGFYNTPELRVSHGIDVINDNIDSIEDEAGKIEFLTDYAVKEFIEKNYTITAIGASINDPEKPNSLEVTAGMFANISDSEDPIVTFDFTIDIPESVASLAENGSDKAPYVTQYMAYKEILKTIDPLSNSDKHVYVVKDEDGNIVADKNGSLLVIKALDDNDVDDADVVPSTYMKQLTSHHEVEEKPIAPGALPADAAEYSVNGK